MYYVYSAAIQCGFRTSVGFGISEKMFSCYTKLGGNSEIAALRDIYVDLPLRQSGMIIPKYEGVSDADTVSK